MQQLISIIVPFYNVQDYLYKSIGSIRKQTYQNIEIILVDDGSTDNSGIICDEFAKKDTRIKVLHLDRAGVVSARKAGIAQAKGEYTLFVDSDDWIEAEMVEELEQCVRQWGADIVTSGLYVENVYISVRKNDIVAEGVYFGEKKKELYMDLMYDGRGRYGILPNLYTKLIRTSLLKKVYPDLCEKIQYGDDAAIVYSCCVLASKVVVTHNVYYHYRQRKDSLTHSLDMHFFSGLNELYIFINKNIQDDLYYELLKKQLDAYFVDKCLLGINFMLGLNHNHVVFPYYITSYNSIPENSKIVLYGAGKIGQDYYIQIEVEKKHQLVGWVDKNYKSYKDKGLEVQPVNMLKKWQYDYIILAFKEERLAEGVKKEILEEYQVEPEKLLWMPPESIWEDYINFIK